MLRLLLTRFILPLLLLWLLRYVFRSVSASLKSTVTDRRQTPAGGELIQDPVCGTYVSPAAAISRTVKGRVVHFCSPACRDKYNG